MDKKLTQIIEKLKFSSEDDKKFGQDGIDMIILNKTLHSPDDNYKALREFLRDQIEFLEIEFNHKKKYSPEIFHPNVSLSRKYESEIYKQILNLLENS